MTKKEMRLKEEVTRAVLSELTSLLTPENKNAVGKNLQEVAKIMAGYSDFNDRGVIGRYDGTFPLSTATKDNVYLEPKTGKYYRCETNYEGIQISAPNSNFVDLSVLANADRFGNLLNLESTGITLDSKVDAKVQNDKIKNIKLAYIINNVYGSIPIFNIKNGEQSFRIEDTQYISQYHINFLTGTIRCSAAQTTRHNIDNIYIIR